MKVLIALDQSPASRRAARVAAALLATTDADLHVIHVIQTPPIWIGATHGFAGMITSGTDDDPGYESARRDDIRAMAITCGVPDPDVEIAKGPPITKICETARRYPVDLVIVGSRDRSPLRRIADPSISAGVLRAASCPVLVVRETSANQP